MRLEGKVSLVSGSGRGIGRAIAERLAREGSEVVVHYGHHEDEAAETREAIEKLGRKSFAVRADLTSAEGRGMIEDSVSHFGRLDVLVNNAGVEKNTPFLDVTEKDYDLVLSVNLRAPFFATQAFARHRKQAGGPGRVIMISSVHEEIPFPGYAAYCASKGGLRMLTRDLAMELAGLGITVNAVAGAIETEMNKSLTEDPTRMAALMKNIPLRRMGQPGDVAGIVAFLASDDAAYVTGSSYFVDGGLTWSYEE